MAVSTTDTYSGPYAANGVTVAFPFTFKAVSAADVAVLLRDAQGSDTVVDEAAYSVALSGEGGTATFTVPPVAGDIFVVSEPSFLQSVQFASGQPFLPSVVNDVNDRAAARDLSLRAKIERGLRAPVGESLPELPPAAARAGGSLGFDSSGGLVVYPQAPVAGEGYTDFPFDLEAGDTQISIATASGFAFDLRINGVVLDLDDDYSVAGDIATLAVAANDGDAGSIRVQKPALLLQAQAANVSFRRSGLTAAAYRTIASKAQDRFDFRDMLGVDLTGNNGQASTLEKALENAQSSGDILHVPLGEPVLERTIALKSGMQVQGVGGRTTFPDRRRGPGSWFKIGHAGVGFSVSEDGFQSNVSLERLGLFWDQPAFTPGWTPADNDFAIVSDGARLLLNRIMLLNPTRAIRQISGSGQIELRDVKGQPFLVGLQVDSGYEGLTVRGLRWWPFWSNDVAYTRAFTLNNRRSMFLRHIDNPYIDGYFDIFGQFPLFFGSHPNGVANNANFKNFEADNFGGTAVYVEPGANGMHATFMGGYSYGYDGSANAIYMNANNGFIQTDCHRFQEINDHAALLQGTGNTLVVNGPEVTNWNKNNNGSDAFAAAPGNKIIINGDVRRTGGNNAPLVNSVNVAASEEYVTVSSLAVAAQTGSITNAVASCRVQRTARRVSGRFTVNVVSNGTGAGDLRVAVPVAAVSDVSFYSSGRNLTTGAQVQAVVNGGTAIITTPANAYPIATGQTVEFSVDYEVPAL